MPEQLKRAKYDLTAFGLAIKLDDDVPLALVYPCHDQKTQLAAAGIDHDWMGVIVDLPHVPVLETDAGGPKKALVTYVKEKMGCGCKFWPETSCHHITNLTNPSGPVRDFAVCYAIDLIGEPTPIGKDLLPRWVTIAELEEETMVRFCGRGKEGRIFAMTKTLVEQRTRVGLRSTPQAATPRSAISTLSK